MKSVEFSLYSFLDHVNRPQWVDQIDNWTREEWDARTGQCSPDRTNVIKFERGSNRLGI